MIASKIWWSVYLNCLLWYSDTLKAPPAWIWHNPDCSSLYVHAACGPEVREAWGCNGESAERQGRHRRARWLTLTLQCNRDVRAVRAARAQGHPHAPTLMRSGSVESKIHSDQQNLSSTQQWLQWVPSRAACQKTAQLARKQPLPRLEKKTKQTEPTAYYSHEKNTMGILWARADARLLFLLLISAAAIWDSAQRSSRQVTEANFRSQRHRSVLKNWLTQQFFSWYMINALL